MKIRNTPIIIVVSIETRSCFFGVNVSSAHLPFFNSQRLGCLLLCFLLLFSPRLASAQSDPGPATGGGIDRSYDDGYVFVDITGNSGGYSAYWGYDNNSQVQGGNLVFHSRSNLTSTVTQVLTDTYSLGGILSLPPAPFYGSFVGFGYPIIPDAPVSRSIVLVTNEAGANVISYSYDSINRLTKVDYGNGAFIRYTYDSSGNRLSYNANANAYDVTPPTITISSPASGTTYDAAINISGTAWDNVKVAEVAWSNDRGGDGTAIGTTNWNINGVQLQMGANNISVTAYDTAGNSSTATLSLVLTTKPIYSTNTLFTETGSGGTIDPTKWTTSGSTVQEVNGYMRIGQDVTDQGGNLYSVPIPINQNGDITITRNVKVHYANNFFHGDMILHFAGLPTVGIDYAYYQWAGNASYGWEDRIGTYISRNNACFICASSDSDLAGPFPVIWDTWFNEKVVYSPTNGNLTLWINDAVVTNFNVGIMPLTNNPTLQFQFDAWGWWTGHEQDFNNLVVSQVTTGDSIPPVISITSPTSGPSFITTNASVNLFGTAGDNVGVAFVAWANNRGGSGTATGTNNWSIAGIPLQTGANVISVTAYDVATNSASATIAVTSIIPQTADDWISYGRLSLTTKNIPNASGGFAAALTMNPYNSDANVLYGIMRILALPYQEAGSDFMTRIGIPVAGRDIYNWTASLPMDTNGVPIVPDGLNANEFISQLSTNVFPAIAGAIGNLSAITDTNYTITLTASETSLTDITVDYGDLKLIRAGLYGCEYLIYLLNAQNLDVQLSEIRSLYTNNALSAQAVLADYPQLLTFTTTNYLLAAKTAFSNAIIDYMAASDFIKNRPSNVVRLFNSDKVSATNEANFRSVLQDLLGSLSAMRVVTLDTNLTVNLGNHFNGATPLRNMLPNFVGNGIVLGSFPDLTFGGIIDGLPQDKIESGLGTYVTMLPFGGTPSLAGNTVQLPFNTLKKHYYVLESSTNLTTWTMVNYFTATSSISVLADTAAAQQHFYRLRDDSKNLAFSGVVKDANTGLPIAGALVQGVYSGTSTYADAQGNFYLNTAMLISSWGADEELTVSSAGYVPVSNWYYGNGLVSGIEIDLNPPPSDDNFANQTILTGTNLTVTGNSLGATAEANEPNPTGNAAGHSVWWSWTAPSDGLLQINAVNTSFWPLIEVYTGDTITSLSAVTNSWQSVLFFVTAGTTYHICIDGSQYSYPSAGAISFDIDYVTVPSNDNFANQTVVTGTSVSVTGSNVGATKEAGEPNNPVNSGGKSVWWAWTAPQNGTVTINTIGSSFDTILAVYTGNSISSLSVIAYNDDYSGLQSQVSFQAVIGTTYLIDVDGYGGSAGNITLHINQ